MKSIFLCFLIIGLSAASYGQQNNFSISKRPNPDLTSNRKSSVITFNQLIKKLPDSSCIRYAALPEDSLPHAVSAEKINDRYYIISTSFVRTYWKERDQHLTMRKTLKKEIDRSLYSKICTLFHLISIQTNQAGVKFGIDKTTYFLSSSGNEKKIINGTAVFHKKQAIMQKIIRLCERLYAYGNRASISQTELLRQVDQLVQKLK